MQKRIENALEEAQAAFWAAIGKAFPEIKTGDFPPDAQAAFDAACESAVETWVTGNSRDGKQDESTNDLNKELLELGFELISTGGGCEAWYLACGQHYVSIIGEHSDRFDHIEIHGVRDLHAPCDPRGTCCEVDDENPQFFSVYVHLKPTATTGGLECVGDFETHPLAKQYAEDLSKKYDWEVRDYSARF